MFSNNFATVIGDFFCGKFYNITGKVVFGANRTNDSRSCQRTCSQTLISHFGGRGVGELNCIICCPNLSFGWSEFFYMSFEPSVSLLLLAGLAVKVQQLTGKLNHPPLSISPPFLVAVKIIRPIAIVWFHFVP